MILVVGATGILGGTITRQLLAQGREVRILARPHSAFAALEAAGARVVFGDLKERASLDRALDGVEIVVTTANSALRGGDDTARSVEHEGNANLIDAARRAGVHQFIFVSALGASPDHPSEFVRGKALSEQLLRESGIPFTILAPNVFMEVWIPFVLGGALQDGRPVVIVGEGRRKHSFVSMDDVAAFAVAAVGNPAALGQYIPIGGPVAVSWTEVVDTTGRVLEREIPVQHVPLDAELPGIPDAVAGLLAAMDTFDSPLDMDGPARTFSVTLTPLEAYVRRAFATPSA